MFTCIPTKSAELVTKALGQMLLPFKKQVLTITGDNGKEFALHQKIVESLQANVYFAHPYHAWERGLNDPALGGINGLIRQYFPKNTDFNNVDKEKVLFVQNRLNQRPRKSLKFDKPVTIFLHNLVALET